LTTEEKFNRLVDNGHKVHDLLSISRAGIDALYNRESPEGDGEQERQAQYDPVDRPKHYANTSIECIDAMVETQGKEAVKAFCICNAFKYLWRHNSKNGDEDIKKAAWYLNKAVELES